ncbi:uncharacterized protein LOC127700074 [Mytilus californianus]|uniref:uncharacterized protein LOC127700074 n=1 Tax=Mytilus californianus TaxID=6549 RepID=UPI002245149D|nr:uncharacterized protein LOC127700074 [Mytilus californianus]
MYPMCFDSVNDIFHKGNATRSNWNDAFSICQPNNLASYRTLGGQQNKINLHGQFWLSNTRRWKRMIDAAGYPEFCVAARRKQNGDVKKIILRCREKLPGICIEVRKTSTNVPSRTSSTTSTVTLFSRRLEKTAPSLQSKTVQGLTLSTYSTSQRSTFPFQLKSTSQALQETSGISKVKQETTSHTPEFQETTSPVLLESPSSDLPGYDGVSAIVILAIIAATILMVIVVLVTVVKCRRKRNNQVETSNESLAMVGKEVVYAQVNKPTVRREKSTSSHRSQPAASDDTYDHMDHCRLSQTHNPTENYDTMRSIANAGEEENNYDHVTGTKMEPNVVVVDINKDYSHVEDEFHEIKDMRDPP